MEVATSCDRAGENDSCCVHTLPDAVEVANTSDLLDEDRSQALSAQLLMDTEEVDFGAEDHLIANADVLRNSRDESNEFAGLRGADANMVSFLPSWSHHSPNTN